jgi:Xaa-Pro dipeptidase
MNSPTIFQERQDRLSIATQTAGLDAILLNPGPSLVYFTGLAFHLSERPVLVALAPGQPLTIILPELETAKVEAISYPLQAFPYGEDPTTWSQVVKHALNFLDIDGAKIGIEPRGLRFLELSLLQSALPKVDFTDAEQAVASLRRINAGVTEADIAAELFMQLVHHGSNPVNPFSPIVSGGPNSANPHATPSGRPLSPGDLLVIDYGAYIEGYFSDITRTFAIESIDPELQQIAAIVLQANQAARSAIKPGVTAHSVDHAARSIIDSTGYGRYFTHRTGHGLGMEVHEEPYIRTGNTLVLETGMTFTIEPGIYLPSRNGVRIEDNVLVTPTGVHTFTSLPRALITLPLE